MRERNLPSLSKSQRIPMYEGGGHRQEPVPVIPTASISKVTSRNTTSGVECPKCGDRARAIRTGHDEEGRVIRQRRCPKGHEFATLEIAVPYSFHRMKESMPPRPSPTGKRLYRPRRSIVAEVQVSRRNLEPLPRRKKR